jgi:signal transduction histidine kinase
MKYRKASQPFKPKGKLLLELGNQLIKDEGIALFELVKNSYDADATEVRVELSKIDSIEKGSVVITDNGSGMDWDTITGVWLEPGTDYREKQVRLGIRSPKFNRLPLGQKGIGRFGAHKLGKRINLVTRSKNENEISVEIDWRIFESDKYLQDIPIDVAERSPQLFTGKKTGTQLSIAGLWYPWTRGSLRNIYRALNSINSPFKSPDSFEVVFDLKDLDKKIWLEGLLSWKEVLDLSLFRAKCHIANDELTYKYEFKPWSTIKKVDGRRISIGRGNQGPIKMIDDKSKIPIDLGKHKIGAIDFDLYMYDLDSNILALGVSDKKGLKEFLQFNGGVRVFRDGVRVYDYGEPGNDWLNLGIRRVNVPTQRLSNNIIIGSVHLNRAESMDLIEKTNREGFIETEAIGTFRNAILFALTQAEAERSKDKERLRNAYSKETFREPVIDDIYEIRRKIERNAKLKEEIGIYLDRIEIDFKDMKDRLLTSAGAGLSLSIVLHEIEKIIAELKHAVKAEKSTPHIKDLTKHLADLVEGYAILVRKSGVEQLKAIDLVQQAIFNVKYRLDVHGIKIICNPDRGQDFVIKKGSKRLLLGAIMNIIDNSIWWIENRSPKNKVIFMGVSNELPEGPSIVVGDNGSGFIDDLEYVTQPFFTRKPDGMGLGLHIANEIMKVHKGKLRILQKGDVSLPPQIDGAIIAMIFEGKSK